MVRKHLRLTRPNSVWLRVCITRVSLYVLYVGGKQKIPILLLYNFPATLMLESSKSNKKISRQDN